MKDTYCDYCNPPYSTFHTGVTGFTNSDIAVRVDEEDDSVLNIGVFHHSANNDALFYDGTFTLPIKYCPQCGRKLK